MRTQPWISLPLAAIHIHLLAARRPDSAGTCRRSRRAAAFAQRRALERVVRHADGPLGTDARDAAAADRVPRELGVRTLEGGLILWDVSTGKELRTFQGRPGQCVAFTTDGKTLASDHAFSFPGARLSSYGVNLWDVVTGKKHEFFFRGKAGDPAGGGEPAPGFDKPWDAATRKSFASVGATQFPITSVAFSANGKTLAAGGSEGEVYVWDPMARPWRPEVGYTITKLASSRRAK